MSLTRVKRARRPKSPTTVAPERVPSSELQNVGEAMRLRARGRAEADMITEALRDAPPLDREAMGSDLHPFNDIASSEVVQAVIEKIVRRRLPESPWHDAHRSLLRTDETQRGYAEFTDAVRDVAFLVGIDYALRSLPSWWAAHCALPLNQREGLAALIQPQGRVR